MPPKAPPPPKEQLDKPDEVLQAVVLADSYNQRFQPLTLDTPRCLLPLANVPLLEWTLESLASAGVKEVIVFCTTKADKVKAYIESRPPSSLHITTIISTSALSVGDALRVLDSQKVIKSDFILLSGDVVSNLNLEEAVEAHKERRKVSKNAIMTMVVKENGLGTRLRPIASSSLFALSPSPENKLLHHEPIGAKPRKKRLNLPGKIFDPKWGEEEIEMRNDLIDCGIDVCSVDVLDLFTENFDYQSIRHDFLPGILQSDLLSSTIHVHFAGSGYAARVSDTLSYDAVSRDVLSRRTWPLVPDGNLPGSGMWEGKKEIYELRRMGVYVTRSTVLSRTCTIGPNTLIGSQSHIHSSTSVRSSIIGRNVTIHPSCTISDSYIWDGATIEEGCTISHAIIGKGVTVGKGSVVGRGCLVGDEVRLGEGAKVEEFTRVGRKPFREDGEESDDEEEEDSEDEEELTDGVDDATRRTLLGSSPHHGYIWPEEGHDSDNDSDSDNEEDLLESNANKRLLQLGRSTSSLCLSDSSGTISVLSQESTPPSSPTLSATSSSTPAAVLPSLAGTKIGVAGAGLTLALEVGDQEGFRSECIATLDHAFEKGGAVDDESIDFAALQIKSARATTNVGPGIVREVVLSYLVDKSLGADDEGTKERPVVKKRAEELFESWGGLLSKFAETEEERVEVVWFLQSHLLSSDLPAPTLPWFLLFLYSLYNADVLSASDLVAWYKHLSSRETPEKEALVTGARAFVEMAVGNEESSSEEESD